MAQATLAFDAPALAQAPRRAAAGRLRPDAQVDDTGFELGWDHARHGLLPPVVHLLPANPLRQGWEAGRAAFGGRTLPASAAVQTWLDLRLQAWTHGLAFESVQVTPRYLAQIDTERCPITRQPLGRGGDDAACVARVFHEAGVAAGNLAVMSRRAGQALEGRRWDEARLCAALAAARPGGTHDGLSAPQWERLAVLASFVTALPHEVAAALPLRLLPPNRLRLLNPIQGLQALITRLLLSAGYAERSARFAELLPAGALRRDYQRLFLSLLPRAWDGGRPGSPAEWRERLEDAWADPVLLRRWQRFAGQLDAAGAEDLVQRAARAGLAGRDGGLQVHALDQATEGWALETAGRAAPGPHSGVAHPVRMLRAVEVGQGVEGQQRVA